MNTNSSMYKIINVYTERIWLQFWRGFTDMWNIQLTSKMYIARYKRQIIYYIHKVHISSVTNIYSDSVAFSPGDLVN